jgi:hydrogenase maturation protein HypF
VSDDEAKMLLSHRAPIVLLKQRTDGKQLISENIAPGNPYLGVMLPYTPLHHLLMEAVDRPIICTSGNLSEDPMAISIEDALARLGSIADVFLTHNRPIVRPVDDSIVRFGPVGLQVMRRARGFAPLPINLKIDSPTILAVGGHLKNTVALCLASSVFETRQDANYLECPACPTVVMSPHIGDLDNLLSIQVFQRTIMDLVDFFAIKPEVVTCDLHPDYASTHEAESLSDKWDVPLVRVQHHHAHVATVMAEHALEGPILGFAWDGTGYGRDGTIWGGEALRCEGAEYTRAAHMRTFALPGGEKAMHEPRRCALGLLHEILGKEAERFAAIWFKPDESAALVQMLERGVNCPRTSSMGRLFDAVATLCGLPQVTSFEGQAAMSLEFLADKSEQLAYPIPLKYDEKQVLVADWEPMIRIMLADLVRQLPVNVISTRFHNALADLALNIAKSVELNNVVLSGGCFQNALLTELVYDRLHTAGYSVILPKEVPTGDGGIALGQIYIAALRSKKSDQ